MLAINNATVVNPVMNITSITSIDVVFIVCFCLFLAHNCSLQSAMKLPDTRIVEARVIISQDYQAGKFFINLSISIYILYILSLSIICKRIKNVLVVPTSRKRKHKDLRQQIRGTKYSL